MVSKLVHVLLILFFLCPMKASSEESKKDVIASYTKEKPVIDGDIEDLWKEGEIKGEFISFITGKPCNEQTKVYLLWGEDYLYVAFEAMVLDIKNIRAASMIRDEGNLRYDDMIGIIIDTYGDGKGGYKFSVNPLGTQADESSRDENWDGIWESKTKILNDRWVVEIKIPFKSLRYFSMEEQIWGVQFARDHRKQSDTSVLFWSGKAFSGNPLYFSTLKGIKIKGGALEKKFIGYGVFQDSKDEPQKFNVGMDVSYPLTPSLRGNLALLPDFSEVETDENTAFPQQFERFLPERRLFFKEGADYFTSRTGDFLGGQPGAFKIFHSRRIGRFDIGGKLSGKIGDYSLGALYTEFDNEKNRVVKIAKDFGKKAYIGIINVEKEKNKVSSSSLDFESSIQFSKNFSFSFERANSFNDVASSAYQSACSYESDNNYVSLGYFDVKKEFDPPNGFVQLTDARGPYIFAEHHKDYEKGNLKKIYSNVSYQNLNKHDGAELYKDIGFVSYILTRNNTALFYAYENSRFLGKNSFSHGFSVNFNDRSWKKLRFYYVFGEFEDFPSHSYGFSNGIALISKLKTYYNLDVSKFTQDGIPTKNLFHRLNFIYEFNPKTTLSLNLRLDGNGNFNPFLVYRKRTGIDTDFYLVLGDPNSIKTR